MCLLCSTPFLLGRSHFRERVEPDKSDSVVPMEVCLSPPGQTGLDETSVCTRGVVASKKVDKLSITRVIFY